MMHYHGVPITPEPVLEAMAGRNFCVSYAARSQVARCHALGQSVMLDNGAYTHWKQGKKPEWKGYYAWCEDWLIYPTTWAIVPDVIDGSEKEQDALLDKWNKTGLPRGAPVWHLHESLERLYRLCSTYDRVCFGSSGEYASLNTDPWHKRIREAFEVVTVGGKPITWLHMLRGLFVSRLNYPFASADSATVALNYWRSKNGPKPLEDKIISAVAIADSFDAYQTPAIWEGT